MKKGLRDSLRTGLNPKSVAVIGASENPNKMGGAARTR
jgi:acyl-CoA synthetase (NDP forming)